MSTHVYTQVTCEVIISHTPHCLELLSALAGVRIGLFGACRRRSPRRCDGYEAAFGNVSTTHLSGTFGIGRGPLGRSPPASAEMAEKKTRSAVLACAAPALEKCTLEGTDFVDFTDGANTA